jgi:hypothetical protein
VRGDSVGVVARVNKRSHEVMETAQYSKYGLTIGRISTKVNREVLCFVYVYVLKIKSNLD